MSCSLQLHTTIEKYNALKQITQNTTKGLLERPALYKVALLVNHIFRAAAMSVFTSMLPLSFPLNLLVCFGASLFYRITVENNCAYKFALPAFAGGIAMPMARPALIELIQKKAFLTLSQLVSIYYRLLPIIAYMSYIVLTVDYDVDVKCKAMQKK